MSGKLAEIIKTGKPPGFHQNVLDPQSADRAIPRALRELEQTHSARRIAKDAGWTVNQLKETWKV